MEKTKDILKFGFEYIKEYRYNYFFYVILFLLMSLTGVILPLISGKIIDLLTGNYLTLNLEKLVGIFVILVFLQHVLSYITSLQYAKIQSESGYKANISSIRKIYDASYKEICNVNPSSLHQMINNDCNIIVIFCITLFRDLLVNIAIMISVFIIILKQSIVILSLFLFLIVFYVIVYYKFKDKLYEQSLKVKNSQTNFFGKLYNLLGNLKSIKINGFFQRTVRKQNSIFEIYKYELIKQIKLSNVFNFSISTITISAQVFLYLYGGNMVLNGEMSIGIFIVLISYFSKLLSSTDYFLNLGSQLQDVKASYDRLMKHTDFKEYSYGKIDINSIDNIYFDNVSFRYKEDNIFKITKSFEKGKVYWIRGKNGSGKTTFINVLTGLFGLDFEGDILINNKLIDDINFSNVQFSNMSIVEQNPFILSESLSNNLICKSKFNNVEDVKNSELGSIFNKLNIDDVVNNRKDGFETEFDSLNEEISGGERQKIALIRTFLSSADVWIFDEPTSALDQMSKKNFSSLIKKYKNSKMIFIISHDELEFYDEIIEFPTLD